MSLNERFANAPGFRIKVRVRPITGISSMSINGLAITDTNLRSERNFIMLLTIDGEEFSLEGNFLDETFTNRNIRGALKARTPGINVESSRS